MSSVTLTQISTNTDLGVALGDISSDGKVVSYITKPTAGGEGEAVSTLYVKRLPNGSITPITEFTVTDPLTTGIDGGALTSDGAFITYTVGALDGGVVAGVENTIYLNETANPTPDENLIPIASALNEGFLPAELSGIYTLYGRNVTIADTNTDDEDSVVRRENTSPFAEFSLAEFHDGNEPGAAGLLITPFDLSSNGTFALMQSELPLDGQETDRDMDVFLVAFGPGGFITRVGQNATSSDNSMSVNGQFIAFTMLGSQGPFDQVWVEERVTQGIIVDTVVSTSAAGEHGNGDSFVTSLSDDGRFVAFISEATNLVPDDTNGQRDLFVKNLETGEVIRVASAGTAANPTILDGELSADGARIAFTTTANIGADQDNLPDVYVADLVFGANRAPTADGDGYALDEDGSLTVAAPGVLADDSDPDNDALTAELVNGATRGSVVLNADGSFTYTPIPNFNGFDSFTYKASDGEAESNLATVSLTVRAVNDAPVAAADAYATDEDTALTIAANGVLANDTDVDGNALTAALVSGPSHGTVALSANGSFTYTPAANYSGPDSFIYKANDGTVDSNNATVSITVNAVNDAPVAAADNYATNEDTALTIAASGVLGNDTDTEGNTLSAAVVNGPAHGSLTLNTDGSFTYTPEANYNGADSFTYKANDGTVDSNVATVSITVNAVPDAPVAVADSYATDEDSQLTVPVLVGVLANDTDPDTPSADPRLVLDAVLVSGPSHGQLFLSSNGALAYQPDADYHGPDSFTYKVIDDTGLESNEATVSLTVRPVNDRPVGTADSANVVEDASFLISVLANDTDVDGDTLSIASLSGSKSALGASIAIVGGQIRYTADADSFDLATFTGTADTFTYVARDPGGLLSDPVTVQVTVSPANDNRTLNGTNKSDSFTDASGFDTTYFANNGNDVVRGEDGSDTLRGGNDNDQLFGGAGIDFLFGENGNDTLNGDAGNDLLAGGAGNDRSRGGDGSDTHVVEKNGGSDTIEDFIVGVDHLQLNGLTVKSLTTADVDHTGALDSVLSFDQGGSVALLGVNGISDWHVLL